MSSLANNPMEPHAYRHDIFFSYSHLDRAWLDEQLLPRLKEAGLRCLTADDFRPGALSLHNMQEAIRESRQTLLLMTPSWAESTWCDFEAAMIQSLDPVGRERRIVPIMIKSCAVPPSLQAYSYLDLTEPKNHVSKLQLLIDQLVGATAQPKITSEGTLDAQSSVDYGPLEEALVGHRWAEADDLTRKIMCSVGSSTRSATGMSIRELQTFPCAELRVIDQLWLVNSSGKFGFSIQRHIQEQANYDREQFGDRVGWRRNGLWIAWPDVLFDFAAPEGHLPIGGNLGLCSLTTAVTAGHGIAGLFESQVEIFKSGALDLSHPGGLGRFRRRLRAEITRKDGFALWWVRGREALLSRLRVCATAR